MSGSTLLHFGVPIQGSVIGPLLVLVYIADAVITQKHAMSVHSYINDSSAPAVLLPIDLRLIDFVIASTTVISLGVFEPLVA